MQGVKKIVITGPESTGKSTLARQLAAHYNTAWCDEYARTFLLTNGPEYVYDHLLQIAKGQLQLEDQMLPHASNGLYFIDTDMYVMKIWSEVRFNNCDKWILQQIAERHYDLYLLCDTDLEWQEDPLREHSAYEERRKLFGMYKDALINSGTPWFVISGTEEQRLSNATAFIDRWLDGIE